MEKEWTIIILIYADFREDKNGKINNDLRREYKRLIEDLENCSLSHSFVILLIENIIMPDKNGRIISDTTLLRKVTADKNSKINKIEEVEKFPTPQMLEKHLQLGQLFKRIHNNYYFSKIGETKGKRYFLITWDHGSAFGIFKQESLQPQLNLKAISFANIYVNEALSASSKIFQLTQQPINRIKNKNNEYLFAERNTEKPIYSYFSEDNELLFQLNATDESHELFQHILINKDYRSDFNLSVLENKVLLEFSANEIINKAPNILDVLNLTEDKKGFLKVNNKLFTNTMKITVNDFPLKTFDILTNDELQKAIVIGFEEKVIDVLLMMNCYMLNVHTCYSLYKNVNFLIAPQGEISEPGYNYAYCLKEIFKSISTQMIEARQVAEACVFSCGYEMWKYRQNFKGQIDQWAIIAIDLTDFDVLAEKIDELGRFAIDIIKLNDSIDPDFIFSNVRNRCIRFDDPCLNYYMIDIMHWLTELLVELDGKSFDLKFLAKNYFIIHDHLDDKIITKKIGPNVYLDGDYQLIQKKPLSTCIYFPKKIMRNDTFRYFIDNNSPNQSSFFKDKKNWMKFLSKDFS
jgi:hypothetical protein